MDILVGTEHALGRQVRHWVRPLDEELLRLQEETLIMRCCLRATGCNRG